MSKPHSEQKTVVIFDERFALGAIADRLESRGIKTTFVDPSSLYSRTHENYTMSALIFEPYHVMIEQDPPIFREALDALIEKAIADKAIKVVLTTQDEQDINKNGIRRGEHYDHFVQKPDCIEGILKAISYVH